MNISTIGKAGSDGGRKYSPVEQAMSSFSAAVNVPVGGPLNEPITSVVSTVSNVVEGTAAFVRWVNDNWQLAIIGFVAIIILLKD